jgi:glucan phosphoethanolaminetransferase (alkaline phosphatase superfamily)
MKTNSKLIFIIALIFFGLYCAPVMVMDIINFRSEILLGVLEVTKNSVYILSALLAIFYGISFSRISFIIGTVIFFLIGAIGTYYNLKYSIKITPEIVRVAIHNDLEEASEFFSIKLFLWSVFSILLSFFLSKKYSPPKKTHLYSIILPLTLLVISVKFLIYPRYKLLEKFQPWQISSSFWQYVQNSPKSQIIDISKTGNHSATTENRLAVFIIGESARYDHFSLLGYERNTNPILSTKRNLFPFEATSCANLTYISVSCMLSRISLSEYDPNQNNETSVISVFNKAGFKTSWFGTQSILKYFKDSIGGSFYDEVSKLILPGGSTLYSMNDYDEKLIPFIKDEIKKEGNKFIVIHTSGSHWDYANRYTKEFEVFGPTCPPPSWGKRDATECEIPKLINIYDNSILYTDNFIGQIIDLLEKEDAFLIYSSDHGESLGENGKYGHGGSSPEQYKVPIIFWGSDAFYNEHKNLTEKLDKLKTKKLNHDYIFHSLLGCSKIKSDFINSDLNLCSE